jgi:hypothetical protein
MLKTGRVPSQVVGYFRYAGVFRRPDIRGEIIGTTFNITLVKGNLQLALNMYSVELYTRSCAGT